METGEKLSQVRRYGMPGLVSFATIYKLDSAARARQVLFDGRDDSVIGMGFPNQLGAGLSNLEYGYLCEIMGRSVWVAHVFNCGAPDTGNREVLLRYGTKEQLQEWLIPLLNGTIRSGFAMTEPQVASSNATNIQCSIKSILITNPLLYYVVKLKSEQRWGHICYKRKEMGKTDFNAPIHRHQSMILVDINTPSVTIVRPLTVFGFEDAPHGHAEISFENVRVPAKNILLGEGRGFEIAQITKQPLKHAYRDGRLEETILRHLGAEDGKTVIAKDIRLAFFNLCLVVVNIRMKFVNRLTAPAEDIKVLKDKVLQIAGTHSDGSNYNATAMYFTTTKFLNLIILKASGSQFVPICNGYEILPVLKTIKNELLVMNIKNEMLVNNRDNEVLESWTGSLCLPQNWHGVKCNQSNGTVENFKASTEHHYADSSYEIQKGCLAAARTRDSEDADAGKGYSDIWLEHLNELEIGNFANLKVELKFVKLILAKSPVLKKVRISLDHRVSYDEELKILKMLLCFFHLLLCSFNMQIFPHTAHSIDIVLGIAAAGVSLPIQVSIHFIQ
ncbi:putative acyl-CoA dehydrogenase IBR3 [Tanacetum coccineum]